MKALLRSTFGEPGSEDGYDNEAHPAMGMQLGEDFEEICDSLHIDGLTDLDPKAWVAQLPILMCPLYWECPYCQLKRPLFKLDPVVKVRLISSDYKMVIGLLVTAQCTKCATHFFPDRITQVMQGGERRMQMLVKTQFLRVSHQGLWVHRNVAVMQEAVFLTFHASASGFQSFLKRTMPPSKHCISLLNV